MPKSREDGFVLSVLLYTVFTDASSIMQSVEDYVFHAEDTQVIAFLDSYTTSFNMIGVAISTKNLLCVDSTCANGTGWCNYRNVAITALSLDRLEDSHWTAHAFLIASLTTGAPSVFFSCAINSAFYGLHTATNIKRFLIKPMPS
jgi:hypothetical protein